MQQFNYHTHTTRCGHACGRDEDYVIQAIRNGYKKIGFSDHMPYKNGYVKGKRMHYDELEDYISSILYLKRKYKDQIEIRIGLEFENYHDQLDEIMTNRNRFDYMILGQHEPALFAPPIYDHHQDKDIRLYADRIVEAIHKGMVDIVAHPDLYMYGTEEWNVACEVAAHKICKAAQEYDVPLELNLNGLKFGKCRRGKEYRYLYPYRKFWEVASSYHVKTIFGLDAHEPQKYADKASYDIVKRDILYDIPLTFLDDLDFIEKLK